MSTRAHGRPPDPLPVRGDLDDLLSRVVAAEEELALGAIDVAAAILTEVEIDLVGLIERAAVEAHALRRKVR